MSARAEDLFDWRHPDYAAVYVERAKRLKWLRASPGRIEAIKRFYKDNPLRFIEEQGCTLDPRLTSSGLPALLPLVLMPKQREMLEWIIERWKRNEPGVIEKSRDCGASVLSMALACTLCLFNDDMAIGIGSAKEDKLDRVGDPNTLFYKGRTFMRHLPIEFRDGWEMDKHAPHMRVLFPKTRSSITGEAGSNVGRGGRSAMTIIDESAHLEHPDLVDAALIATTDCRIDISSVNGMANSFARRRHSGKIKVFTFHYRDDLRKDDEWRKCKQETTDSVIWNAEYELNYTASVEGIIIPQEHVQAAVDAHVKLAITPSGMKRGALDVADEGKDRNAFAARHGILLTQCESWSGKGSDIFETVERAVQRCDDWDLDGYDFDSDGLGAGVRGDYTRIAARRKTDRMRALKVSPYRGSEKVFEPERKVPGTDVKAIDRFQNAKAQSWSSLAERFRNTFRAVNGGDYDPDNLISLSSDIKELSKLCIELSQPQWKISATGKLMVDKQPDGMSSPNLADSVCILFSPRSRPMRISDSVFDVGDNLGVM